MKIFNLLSLYRKKFEDEKGFNDFVNIISRKTIGDEQLSVESTIQQFKNCFARIKNKKIGIIVFATKHYFSSEFIEAAKVYAQDGVQIILAIDRTIKKDKNLNNKLSSFKQNKNVSIMYFSRAISTCVRMKIALAALNAEYVMFFTMKDVVNSRSLLIYINNIISSFNTPVILHSQADITNIRQTFLRNPAISILSGSIFDTAFLRSKLKEISEDWDFWLPYILFTHIDNKNITIINSIRRYWNINNATQMSIPDIGFLCRDMMQLVSSSKENHAQLRNTIDQISLVIYDLIRLKNLTETKYSYIASGSAILLASLYNNFSQEEYRDVLYQFSSSFNFDLLLKRDSIHKRHKDIVEKVIPLQNDTVAVIETDFMEDLKHSFVHLLEKKYEVLYITKPQYYDYHFFYCMVMRAIIQPAQYIITSNDLHKYITAGKTILTLWHGCGMLKEIVPPDRKKYPMDYLVTSSVACVEPWSKQFNVEESHVLPFGQIQTDMMFDKVFSKNIKDKVRSEYNIPDDAKVVFFAPTFRNAAPGVSPSKYYNFQIDIESLSKKLEECKIYIITKRHHVFSHILLDKGIDSSGVSPSRNGYFIVDETHSFQELICAADIFITDYSSGLFYAVIRDMPLVLYAPDIEDYKEGANGFMVKYPEDVAGVFVGKPDIDTFVKAIEDAQKDVSSEKYLRFKEKHVAACDGHVAERLLRYLDSWDGIQFTDIITKANDKDEQLSSNN